MRRVFVIKLKRYWLMGLLMIVTAAPAPAQTPFNEREKTCFDSQTYRLVPCPQSGKPIVLAEEEEPPEEEALSFLQALQPYTKLDENGDPLPESADEWAMVRDNERGLIWEIKNRDRDSAHFYAQRFAWEDLQEGFIDPLNEGTFGGFSDWRLPTAEELSTLMIPSTRVPMVDIDLFPYTRPDSYWTGLFRTDTPDYACHVDFYLGNVHYSPKSQKNYARAVREADEFQEERRITRPAVEPVAGEAFKEPRGGITDPYPDREETKKAKDLEQRKERERFTEPRRGITDLPPDRKGQTVPLRRMKRQQRQ